MNDFCVGKVLRIDRNTLVENMHTVQKRNLLSFTELEDGVPQFCIELETGTGKTCVYTKTIFELHRKYGFTRFIIIVPSVAI